MGKTKYLVGTFLATALLISGCSDSENVEENPAPAENSQAQKLAGQRLTDDNGVEYTLIDNGDGTETARYDDGRSVTFKRQEDGSLDYLYGAAGLLATMAAGYYLFHGFSGGGTWDASRNRYTVSEPLKRVDDNRTASGGGGGRTTTNTNTPTTNTPNANANTNTPATNTNTNSNSKVNLSKDTAATKPATTTATDSSAKTGFGTAGARGGTSAAS